MKLFKKFHVLYIVWDDCVKTFMLIRYSFNIGYLLIFQPLRALLIFPMIFLIYIRSITPTHTPDDDDDDNACSSTVQILPILL